MRAPASKFLGNKRRRASRRRNLAPPGSCDTAACHCIGPHMLPRILVSLPLLLALAAPAFAQDAAELVVRLGRLERQMRTISYGKERPVAVCNDISCWSQNRRAVTVLNASS